MNPILVFQILINQVLKEKGESANASIGTR